MKYRLQAFFLRSWYRSKLSWFFYPLIPLSWLLRGIIHLRRWYITKRCQPLTVPVIVIGNIALGGTGKTPCIMALANWLKQVGYQPVIISRGYKARCEHFPYLVLAEDGARYVGDEIVLLKRATSVPIVIDPERARAAQFAINQCQATVILSDDGLQHYRLWRDIEVAMIDGQRLLGNQQLLPAGPLREPVSRLTQVDFVLLANTQIAQPELSALPMPLVPLEVVNVKNPQQAVRCQQFVKGIDSSQNSIALIAGIGHPERFFITCQHLGLDGQTYTFEDHHDFQAADFSNIQADIILMTEKDAVKCESFAQPNWWFLRISAHLPEAFCQGILAGLQQWKVVYGQKNT